MATIKEFQNGQTGVQVYVIVNYDDKSIKARMIDAWSNGYIGESNGKKILAWMKITKDAPVVIPDLGISIKSEFAEQLPTDMKGYQNHFTITVTKGGNSETFDYHASINDAGKGIVNLSDNDKIGAFYCFVGDALSGMTSFDEFKSDYGYDDCCEAHKIWKLCKESTRKATRLGLGDLYELSNFIQERYPDVV
jgi:hypothetical protein